MDSMTSVSFSFFLKFHFMLKAMLHTAGGMSCLPIRFSFYSRAKTSDKCEAGGSGLQGSSGPLMEQLSAILLSTNHFVLCEAGARVKQAAKRRQQERQDSLSKRKQVYQGIQPGIFWLVWVRPRVRHLKVMVSTIVFFSIMYSNYHEYIQLR